MAIEPKLHPDLIASMGQPETTNQKIERYMSEFSIGPDTAALMAKGLRLDQAKTRWNSDILDYDFPEPKFVVNGIIPEGLTILAGRPKVGKSWLVLQMLKAIGTGTNVFNENVEKRNCLYLALEDYPRRLQARLKKQGWTKPFDVTFDTKLPEFLDQGGVDWLKGQIKNSDFQFVVLDTYAKAISPKIRQKDESDTIKVGSALHEIAWGMDCPIVIIDHFRKSGVNSAEDVVDEVSGSTGKTGIADTIIGIFKQRSYSSGQLKISGRDVSEQDLTIEWIPDTCTWDLLGNTQDVIANKAEAKCIRAIQDNDSQATLAEIEQMTGWSESYAYKILSKLENDGILSKDGRGSPYAIKDDNLIVKDIFN